MGSHCSDSRASHVSADQLSYLCRAATTTCKPLPSAQLRSLAPLEDTVEPLEGRHLAGREASAHQRRRPAASVGPALPSAASLASHCHTRAPVPSQLRSQSSPARYCHPLRATAAAAGTSAWLAGRSAGPHRKHTCPMHKYGAAASAGHAAALSLGPGGIQTQPLLCPHATPPEHARTSSACAPARTPGSAAAHVSAAAPHMPQAPLVVGKPLLERRRRPAVLV